MAALPPSRTPPTRGHRVLVIEDEGMVAALLEDMLAELGLEVAASASRLPKAMAMAKDGTFDVAILDVNLDGTPSYPAADLLTDRGIPVILSTGYGAEGVDKRFAHFPVLRKPFALEELQEILARALS